MLLQVQDGGIGRTWHTEYGLTHRAIPCEEKLKSYCTASAQEMRSHVEEDRRDGNVSTVGVTSAGRVSTERPIYTDSSALGYSNKTVIYRAPRL